MKQQQKINLSSYPTTNLCPQRQPGSMVQLKVKHEKYQSRISYNCTKYGGQTLALYSILYIATGKFSR